jgi:hypothetical protein
MCRLLHIGRIRMDIDKVHLVERPYSLARNPYLGHCLAAACRLISNRNPHGSWMNTSGCLHTCGWSVTREEADLSA